jgi:hypothetical protein
MVRRVSTLEVQSVSSELLPRSHSAARILVSDLVSTGSYLDCRMAMPRLFAFYLPRVLVADRRKIEDTVKKAIQ